ncbi:sigma-70 family RNA polymerase sigma factor [Maribacter polysiphoniae]|uniref:RNA polymerase sigma-70 factor (ECF subfamily) n=1 Tax=Maribacter polysiphoniae TaxID=429344 RepID=A0A316DX37_9FLAO|nr:sigma-70 family RNA polymerase sigma factor [Maribacter polysiphoniae]MBD1262635.1 sigma-70 family RNA polymerase sigma factor [Maribacter polysiphoniae]PWK21163.1 RNA polymerase sigma-70 factor (ECF subfamily) [Maribacter polysiphoniae]
MKAIIEEWFHEYSDDLYGWAYHKTSSKEVAEDLVQETFLSAVKGLKKFQNKSNPKTWLFAILNNKIIDHYRKKAKSAAVNNERLEHKYTNTTDSFFDSNQNWKVSGSEVAWEEEVHLLDNSEFKKTLDQCVDKLPDNWRLAVVSKYLTDKTTDQICQEMNVNVSNYWQIVHRSKLMLKKCIDNNWKH